MRPHCDLEEDWDDFVFWMHNHHMTMNSVFNTFLPAIIYAMKNCLIEDAREGKRYVRADFGDILVRESGNHFRQSMSMLPNSIIQTGKRSRHHQPFDPQKNINRKDKKKSK